MDNAAIFMLVSGVIILMLLVVFPSQFNRVFQKMETGISQWVHRYITKLPDMPEGILKIWLVALLGGLVTMGVRAMVTSSWVTGVVIGVAILLILYALAVIENNSAKKKQAWDKEFMRQMKIEIKNAVKDGIKEAKEEAQAK
jgi:hypothetical protein